jgi:hypothetical protein
MKITDFTKYNDDATTFDDDVFADLGISDNPKRHKLMAIAWEHGHSCGYSEVYYYASELVELIKEDS